MSNKLKYLFLTSLLSLSFLSSCSNDSTSSLSKKLFFSELYNGESINDCVLEIGTTSENELSLNGITINFYNSNEISYSYLFKDETISKNKLVLFVNDYSSYTNDFSSLIKLDDNYICGRYYAEMVDDKGKIIDTIGYKGVSIDYVRDGSLIRLNEYRKGRDEFETLDYISFRSGYDKNLGILDCPLSLDEVLNGPSLDESRYGGLGFAKGNKATNGYSKVSILSLGDGDTTHFKFPKEDGISDDYSSRVRYLLINTPEIDHGDDSIKEEPYGKDAQKFNNERLKKATLIVVQSAKDESLKDTYGRTLGFVWYTDKENPKISDLKLLNFELVKEGLAKLSDGDYKTLFDKDVLYQDYFKYAKTKAEKERKNIYSLLS